jgi:hypothetical protein
MDAEIATFKDSAPPRRGIVTGKPIIFIRSALIPFPSLPNNKIPS